MRTIFQDVQPALGQFSQDLGFPDDYFVFDLETSGFSRKVDVVTQIGWAVIRGRQVVDNQALTLNWTTHPGMDQAWLRKRLLSLAESYRDQGKTLHLTYDALRASPCPAIDGLRIFDELLAGVLADQEWLIGHNLAVFDTEMMDAHRIRYLGDEQIDWPPNGIFDTGLFLKAAQLGKYPTPGESLDDFFRSVAGVRAKGVYWAMDKYCVPAFDLETRFGVDIAKCHDGGYDCWVNHCLFESMREVGEAYG